MNWILNDLSLSLQFCDVDDFACKMAELLKAKSSSKLLERRVLCSRQLGSIEVIENLTFSHVVMKYVNPNLRKQILSWIDKNGPFWCDEKTPNRDDYFEYQSINVTDLGLGECARRIINGVDVRSYSFDGEFGKTPLAVQHGLAEEPFGTYDIDNIWGVGALKDSAQGVEFQPKNWKEAIDRLKERFPGILFSDYVYNQMDPVPYSEGNFESLCERFRVLTEYLDSRDLEGRHTEKSESILKDYFQGDKAWFSGESDRNIKDFEAELKFEDLFDGKRKLFPFHGKIKTPQLRIHIEWPIPPARDKVQVVYVGPKITKR